MQKCGNEGRVEDLVFCWYDISESGIENDHSVVLEAQNCPSLGSKLLVVFKTISINVIALSSRVR
jgi:hypothetical protein